MRAAGRRVEAPVAFAGIPDGARILIGSYAGTPVHLLEALAAERGRWESLTVLCNLLLAPVPLTAFAGAPFRFLTLQPSAALRDATDAGHVEVTPARYSDCARLFTPHGALPPDAALVQVSAPGPESRFSLGASVGAIIDAVRSAPLVIAQVNREMPYTFGAGELRRDEIDYLVEIDGPIVELTRDPPGAAAERIAEHVAALGPRRSHAPVRHRRGSGGDHGAPGRAPRPGVALRDDQRRRDGAGGAWRAHQRPQGVRSGRDDRGRG